MSWMMLWYFFRFSVSSRYSSSSSRTRVWSPLGSMWPAGRDAERCMNSCCCCCCCCGGGGGSRNCICVSRASSRSWSMSVDCCSSRFCSSAMAVLLCAAASWAWLCFSPIFSRSSLAYRSSCPAKLSSSDCPRMSWVFPTISSSFSGIWEMAAVSSGRISNRGLLCKASTRSMRDSRASTSAHLDCSSDHFALVSLDHASRAFRSWLRPKTFKPIAALASSSRPSGPTSNRLLPLFCWSISRASCSDEKHSM
mmetsp:Transcript_22661/g.51107  ORF Transcript_22661/g.51107 Transcript_22661/m.51107 type:complete len:252 (-) Transcript_22661:894-1649(-)